MRKILFSLLLVFCLSYSQAQAVTVASDIDTDFGDIAAGDSISVTLSASGYEAEKPSNITWLIKVNEGSNPGFKLDRRRGDTVVLNAASLNRPRPNGIFSLTVTAQDVKDTGTIILKGRVVNKPAIRTEAFANAQAGGERNYVQRLEFNTGSDPLELTISGDFPDGLGFGESEIRGRKYHVVTGNPVQTGTFNFTLTAVNSVGSDSKNFTLQSDPVKAKIRTPKDFVKEHTVTAGEPFAVSLNGFQFSGTQPLAIDVDDTAKELGIAYDADNNSIAGTIPDGTKTRRAVIKLLASNEYDKPASVSFILNIQSPARDIRLFPAPSKLQKITDASGEINALPLYTGRFFRTQFKANIGTRPITWDYVIAGTGEKIVQDLGGNFGGLVFSADGSIAGTPEKRGTLVFTAEAANPSGTAYTEPYELVFGSAPSFDREKLSVPVKLLSGRSASVNPSDYIIAQDNGRFSNTITITGDFPPGMAFDGTLIKGIPMALAPDQLKRYTLNVAATNAFGTARGRILLELQDVPRIGDIPETLTGRAGNTFRFALPTEAKRPYTWRLVYQNEDVDDEIGDSGITWNPRTGVIFGPASTVLEGTYRVTAHIKNEVGEDSRTFTIKINP